MKWLGSANARNDRVPEESPMQPRLRSAAAPLSHQAQKHPIALFILGTFVWSWGIWLALIASELSPTTETWDVLYVLGLSGPTMVAFGISSLSGGFGQAWRLLCQVSMGFGNWRFVVIALCLPPLLSLGALLLSVPWPRWSAAVSAPSLHGLVLFFGIMMLRSGPLNEEFGWRGFVLPRLLQRFSPFTASLLLAPVWTLWHLPLWLLPLLPHKYWPFSWFVLLIFPVTLLFTWLHLRTNGQLLFAVIFHTSINTSVYYLPILPPRQSSFAPFGTWITLAWIVALVIVVRRWKEWVASPLDLPARAARQPWGWPRLQQCLAVMAPARACRRGKTPPS